MEMVRLENGALVKSMHGGLYKDTIWYALHGNKGRMESARGAARADGVDRVYVDADAYDGEYPAEERWETYRPADRESAQAAGYGHGGSDFYSMYYFIQKILGDETADVIGVYEALDMALPGMFAFRSILAGGKEMPIPNLRSTAERELWRNDVACTFPTAAGDRLLPTRKGGTPEIPMETYDRVREKWEAILAQREKENE